MQMLKEKNIDVTLDSVKSITRSSILMKKTMADEKNSII